MCDGRGGARAGAGRKPKELRYWSVAQDVEDRIAAALPAVIEKMIDMAKDGDVSAARYLCDRILGRTAPLEAPPAFDRTMPYTDHDFEKFASLHRPHLLDPQQDESNKPSGVGERVECANSDKSRSDNQTFAAENDQSPLPENEDRADQRDETSIPGGENSRDIYSNQCMPEGENLDSADDSETTDTNASGAMKAQTKKSASKSSRQRPDRAGPRSRPGREEPRKPPPVHGGGGRTPNPMR